VSKSEAFLKYSKASAFYLNAKKDFFTANDELLKKSLNQNKLYASQPNRISCKVCQAPLPQTTDFRSHNVDYVFCEKCSHLNGRFEDTKSFIEKLYIAEDGIEYSKNYIDENFLKKTTDVYIPKVDFLVTSLPPKKYEILDVGCGNGNFVYASLLRNLSASGLDVSKTMIDFGNNQISHHFKKSPLTCASEEDFYDSIIKSNADVISAIGVIEHLREPHKFFIAFQKSKAKYLYYVVPMFSFSVVLENVSKNVFPRLLSEGHTHLFTESSIKKMNEIIGVQAIAEWRFGADAMDLYRHLLTNLQANKSSQKMIDFFNAGFREKIDDLQAIFDKNHFCSELHLIACKL
jgi:SAM-dependent methyltransferase